MSLQPDIWPQDPWGRVLNGAVSREELPANVLTMAESAVDLAHERFEDELHSVYVAGEVARNLGREAELIVVLKERTKPVGLDLFAAAAGLRLQREHGEFETCKFSVLCWEDVFPADGRFSAARFKLAVNSVTIAGRDLKGLISPQRLTPAVSNTYLIELEDKLFGYIQRLKAISTETRVLATSRKFAQAALKGAFALVMADEQVYSEDPETMASFVGLTFTENRQSLASLARMSRAGTYSGLEALAIARDAFAWLSPEIETWLNTYNPERQLVLPLG